MSRDWPRWLWLLGPAILLLGLFAHPPIVSPDAVEMAAAGGCMWRLPLDATACVGLEPWFWPPAYPLISGLPVALGGDPAVAATVVSVVCWALLVWPLGALLRSLHEQGGAWAAALIAPCLLAIPQLPLQALMGDARSLALVACFASASLGLGPLTRARALGMGALAGLACLARPEAVLPATVLVGYATVVGRSGWALGACAALVGPYVGLLSWQSGGLAITSRGWQGGVTSWLATLPAEWVKHDLAAGAWGAPLRASLTTDPVAATHGATLDPTEVAAWMRVVFVETLPTWLYGTGLAGLVLARKRPRALILVGLAALPSAVFMLMPQAQDPLLPLNNLQPMVVGLAALAVVALGAGVAWVQGRWALAGPMPGIVLAGGLFAWGVRPGPRPDFTAPPSFLAASNWLASEHPDATVGASLVSAPVPLRAGVGRRHLPAPWSAPHWLRHDPPDLVVLSSQDLPGSLRTARTLAPHLQALVVFEGAEGWVVVYEVAP